MHVANLALRREIAPALGYPSASAGARLCRAGKGVLTAGTEPAGPTKNTSIMETLAPIKRILRDTLSLGSRADQLTADSPLLGALPEFDSMAVVGVITALENEFGFTVNDDEMSAEVFATVGSLAQFAARKLSE